MPYGHLSREEREDIAIKRDDGWTLQEIAEYLGRSPSTISRELKRNRHRGHYWPDRGHQLAMKRRRRARRPLKLDDPSRWKQVEDMIITGDWSPRQVAAKLEWNICHQTIYSYIRRKKLLYLRKHLRHGMRPYRSKKKGKRQYQRIRNLRPISERPQVVSRRKRFWDWECDTIYGSGRRSNIIVCVERRTGFVVLVRLNSQQAKNLNQALVRALKRRRLPVRTLTVDRGMEFSMHQELEAALDAKVYFTDPHCGWQKGIVENTNGLLRQYLPKGMDLGNITQRELNKIARKLNNRPRETKNFQTPAELLAAA